MQQLRLDTAAAAYERMHDAHMLQAVHALSERIVRGLPRARAEADALAMLVCRPLGRPQPCLHTQGSRAPVSHPCMQKPWSHMSVSPERGLHAPAMQGRRVVGAARASCKDAAGAPERAALPEEAGQGGNAAGLAGRAGMTRDGLRPADAVPGRRGRSAQADPCAAEGPGAAADAHLEVGALEAAVFSASRALSSTVHTASEARLSLVVLELGM